MATRLSRQLSNRLITFLSTTECCRGNSLFRSAMSRKAYLLWKYQPRFLHNSIVKKSTYSSFLPFRKSMVQHCSCAHRNIVTTTDEKSSTLSPNAIVNQELSALSGEIRELLRSSKQDIQDIAQYYFDGQGKAFRPMLVLLLSKALNFNEEATNRISKQQHQVALITEMIHTASLVHDDVIDAADTRRNKPSVNKLWGQRKAILAGDFILSVAAMTLARIRHEEVVIILSRVIEDLVRGEFMQLGSKEDENERFSHYLRKTFKKTASLLANSCKAVAVLGNCNDDLIELAFQYGRHIGIAFQLIDDILDYVSSEAVLGKPTTADLKLGLATAPVLFAAQQYPELHPLIMRRFTEEGDVEKAVELVKESDGVRQTRFLAERHCEEAVSLIKQLAPSPAQSALIQVAHLVLSRNK